MKILITGITGFVGSHLAEYIINEHPEHQIFGLCRWRSSRENIRNVIDKITLIEGDLKDANALLSKFKEYQFDLVFHLAAQSYVATSFNSAAETLQTNVLGTANLLNAILQTNQTPKIHICSSSEVYGQVSEENLPIKETCPLRPASPYAVSKVAEDMLGLQYFLSYGMKTVRSRSFTHTGARRGDIFFLSAFAKQIACIEQGLNEPIIKVGNLSSVRTLCDVRDMVRAYWLLLEKGEIGEVYNIGGQDTMTVGEALQDLLSFTEMKDKIKVVVDPQLLRPSDVTLQIPDTTKFKKRTGWSPKYNFKDTCKSILDFWRQEILLCPWKKVSVIK